MPVKVIDASAAAALLFVEAEAPLVVDAMGDGDFVAPTLLNYELANVCLKKFALIRPTTMFLRGIRAIDDLAIKVMEVTHRRVLELAERTGLTVYDASYLQLAIDLDAAFVTLDKRLAAAAQKLAVRPR